MIAKRFALCLSLILPQPLLAQVPQGAPNANFEPAFKNQTRAPQLRDAVSLQTQTILRGLSNPWGVEVLPDGGYLVTERAGRLRAVLPDGKVTNIKGVPKVLAQRQGGLLDVALTPDFATSRRLYLTYAKPLRKGSATAAATGILNADHTRLTDVRDIFVQTPASPSPMHYGSRIVLTDAHAYITLGEHSTRGERVLAQDLRTTYGKVVRLNLNGDVPTNNPFSNQKDALASIYTYGHRNPQGADIHPKTGDLWTLEHGPAGGDELNRIEVGANYGWPVVSYGENYSGSAVGTGKSSAMGFTEPRYYWDPVIAPGGFAFYDGDMFDWQGDVIAASLNPGGIVRLRLNGTKVTGEARYLGNLGRVRDIEIDRDGAILVLVDDSRNGALVRITPK